MKDTFKTNETIKTIISRRSVRGFKSDAVSNEDLNDILECGLCAPSALNSQDWHFSVLQKADLISKLNEEIISLLPKQSVERMTARNGGEKDFSVFYNAPALIVVSEKQGEKWSTINCALATQNMLLAAESLGLGSIIIGFAAALFNSENYAKYIGLLGIPEGYKAVYVIAIGYKNVEMSKPERLENRVSFIK